MWKNSEWVKKKQKIKGQLGGKVAIKAATGAVVVIKKEAIKDKKGEIQDKEVLNALFNKTV